LSESASALKRTEFATTAGWVRSLRAVAAEPVKNQILAGAAIKEAGSTAGQQLHRPLGQQAGLDDLPNDGDGEVGGLAGRLHDRRHACEEGRGKLLEEPQTGKLKALICTATPRRGV
jgi:hypothetical protein